MKENAIHDQMSMSEYADMVITSSAKLTRLYGKFDEKSTIWNLNAHSHTVWEFIYFLEGCARVDVNDQRLSVSLYNALLYPPNVIHHEHLIPGDRQIIINFLAEVKGIPLAENAICVQDRNMYLRAQFEFIFDEANRANPCQQLISYAIKNILMFVYRESVCSEQEKSRVEIVMQYIHDHLTDKLSVDLLADKVHVCTSYLSRIFKEEVGISIIQYINNIRIESARYLLHNTEKSIEEISEIIGFKSPKYFSKVFSITVGISPSEYRAKMKWEKQRLLKQ